VPLFKSRVGGMITTCPKLAYDGEAYMEGDTHLMDSTSTKAKIISCLVGYRKLDL